MTGEAEVEAYVDISSFFSILGSCFNKRLTKIASTPTVKLLFKPVRP
jgi:hypothetical protein